MDNHGMDDHDLDIKRLDDPKWKLMLENPKVRLVAALALGVALGSGATWGMLKTDQPRSAKGTIIEQRKADPKIKAQSNSGSTRSVKQTTATKKSKTPVKVVKKDTKKHPVTSTSAKKKSTSKPATSKTKPATKTTTTAKATKKKKRSTTAKPANASTKPATTKPATSTSNTTALKPPAVDSKSAQPVTTARIHTMVPE